MKMRAAALAVESRCNTGHKSELVFGLSAIMAIGVAVANAILLVTFAEFNRKGGTQPGALVGTANSTEPMFQLETENRLRLVVAVPEIDVGGIVRGGCVPFS